MKQKILRLIKQWQLELESGDRVLEVGSGHNPSERSDVLVDKYPEHNDERGGEIETLGRPFISADVCNLPFNENEFDYTLAYHVLEHVNDPTQAAEELTRVSSAGYVVCPSLFWEILRPKRDYHQWVVLNIDNKLIFHEKKDLVSPILGDIFEGGGIMSKSLFLRLFFRQFDEMFIVRHKWEERLNVEVDTSGEYKKYFCDPYDIDKLEKVVGKNCPKSKLITVVEEVIYSIYKKFFKM